MVHHHIKYQPVITLFPYQDLLITLMKVDKVKTSKYHNIHVDNIHTNLEYQQQVE